MEVLTYFLDLFSTDTPYHRHQAIQHHPHLVLEVKDVQQESSRRLRVDQGKFRLKPVLGTTRNRIAAGIAFVSGVPFLLSGYRTNIETYNPESE